MLGGPPRQRLDRMRRVVRAARPHDGCAEDPEVGHFVSEPPPVDDVRVDGVAHPGSAIGVSGRAHGAAHRGALNGNRARRPVPLLHLVLTERRDVPLVLLVFGRNADHRKSERVLHLGIQVEVVVLIRQRCLLDVRVVRAIGVLLDERLPLRPPRGRHPVGVHAGGRDRSPIGHEPQVAAADEIERRVVEIVVGPVVDGHALRRQSVPAFKSYGKSAETPAPWWWLR